MQDAAASPASMPNRDLLLQIIAEIRWPQKRRQIIEQLESMDRPHVLRLLHQLVLDPDEDTSEKALRAVLAIGTLEEQRVIVLPEFFHPDSAQRNFVLQMWHGPANDELLILLLGMLVHDPDANNRALAAALLGQFADQRAITALTHVRDHDQGRDFQGSRVASYAERSIEQIQRREAS